MPARVPVVTKASSSSAHVAFSGNAGDLRYANHLLQGDVNGDRRADFEISVNIASLLNTDFVL